MNLFLAGDGVQLLRDTVLDSLVGIGTGALREHFDDIAARGGKFYLSGMSSKPGGLASISWTASPRKWPCRTCWSGWRSIRTHP